MPLVALMKKDATMQLRASSQGAATATAVAEEETPKQNPMVMSAGKMMTRT
jgi:hypothetical protein